MKIEKTFPATAGFDDPFLLEVVGRCPPEDVGGPWGYEEFREAIADPNHERHHELVGWWGDAHYDPGDVDAANLRKNVETLAADEITDGEWQATMDVNITGMFYMVRAATPLFRRQRSGSVVNMSSVAGRIGMPLRTPYSVSKYAVRGLTEVLAIELGEVGVRVNALLPGLVDGPRGQRAIAEQAAARDIDIEKYERMFLHNISMHTKVQMEEVADMAAFLGSDLAPHISGQSISVDGNFESYRAPVVA